MYLTSTVSPIVNSRSGLETWSREKYVKLVDKEMIAIRYTDSNSFDQFLIRTKFLIETTYPFMIKLTHVNKNTGKTREDLQH